MLTSVRGWSALILNALLAAATTALAAEPQQVADLADLSIEELSNIQVTSVSKHAERLAPNLEVARASASSYAISARGFNNTIDNKLLVLIDGRTVYTPLFSGVFWDAQD